MELSFPRERSDGRPALAMFFEGPSRRAVIEQWQRHETFVQMLGLHDPARAEFNSGPEPFEGLRPKALLAKTLPPRTIGAPREFDRRRSPARSRGLMLFEVRVWLQATDRRRNPAGKGAAAH
jgi:hypothetical protein